MITAKHACPSGIEGISASSVPCRSLSDLAREAPSFGTDQMTIAKLGICPCTTCPDCYMEDDGGCRNEHICTAWDTYCYHY